MILMDQPTREEWLEQRSKGIGSTDISSIMGRNPYKSALEVWLEKTGQHDTRSDSIQMELGRYLEPKIAELYERKKGVKLMEWPGMLAVHPKAEWAMASPDRTVEKKDLIVEIKSIGERSAAEWGEEGTDEIPEYYLLQVQWQMLVTGIPICDLSVLTGKNKHSIYHSDANPELQGIMFDTAERFWNDYVLSKNMPPVDFAAESPELVNKLFKQKSEDMIRADEEILKLLLEYSECRRQSELYQESVDAYENKIKAIIGEHSGIEGNGWKVTWKKSKDSSTTDWKAIVLASNIPQEIIRQHTQYREGSRRFLYKYKEEK